MKPIFMDYKKYLSFLKENKDIVEILIAILSAMIALVIAFSQFFPYVFNVGHYKILGIDKTFILRHDSSVTLVLHYISDLMIGLLAYYLFHSIMHHHFYCEKHDISESKKQKQSLLIRILFLLSILIYFSINYLRKFPIVLGILLNLIILIITNRWVINQMKKNISFFKNDMKSFSDIVLFLGCLLFMLIVVIAPISYLCGVYEKPKYYIKIGDNNFAVIDHNIENSVVCKIIDSNNPFKMDCDNNLRIINNSEYTFQKIR